MADEPAVISPIRLVRWTAVLAVLLFAVALYFRFGTNLSTITGSAPGGGVAPDSGQASEPSSR